VYKVGQTQSDNPVTWGGLQEHQTPRSDGVSPTLTAAMGMGGGQTPIFTERNDSVGKVGQISSEGSQCGSVFSDDGNMGTLTAGSHGNANPHILTREAPGDEERNIIEILRILKHENGDEDFFEWSIRGLWCILSEEVVRDNISAKIVLERWVNTTYIKQCTYGSEDKYKYCDVTDECVKDMWKDWQDGCIKQMQSLSRYHSGQFDDFVSRLPFDKEQEQKFVYCLRQVCGLENELLYQVLNDVQYALDCVQRPQTSYRIRKLTERECWRLMSFSDEDFEKAAAVNSKTQLYKQAGNSIVKNVLMAIFGQMIPGKENVYKENAKGSETDA
jgi:hypothetical protein